MIYEMRTYTVKVGKQHAYIKHFEEVGLPIISKYAKLIGYWYSDIGELNQIIHIWNIPISIQEKSEGGHFIMIKNGLRILFLLGYL